MKRPIERTQTKRSVPESTSDSSPVRMDRRSVLIGSAGLAAGGVLASTAARADGNGSTQPAQSQSAKPGSGAGNRLYSSNPTHSDMADISQNPANVPPAITRREPATVRLEFETIEIEAHLDAKAAPPPGPVTACRSMLWAYQLSSWFLR